MFARSYKFNLVDLLVPFFYSSKVCELLLSQRSIEFDILIASASESLRVKSNKS